MLRADAYGECDAVHKFLMERITQEKLMVNNRHLLNEKCHLQGTAGAKSSSDIDTTFANHET